jgi:hypothetical protein
MLKTLRLSTLIALAFAVGYVARGAMSGEGNAPPNGSTAASPAPRPRCGDADGVRYLLEHVGEDVKDDEPTVKHSLSLLDIAADRERARVRTVMQTAAKSYWHVSLPAHLARSAIVWDDPRGPSPAEAALGSMKPDAPFRLPLLVDADVDFDSYFLECLKVWLEDDLPTIGPVPNLLDVAANRQCARLRTVMLTAIGKCWFAPPPVVDLSKAMWISHWDREPPTPFEAGLNSSSELQCPVPPLMGSLELPELIDPTVDQLSLRASP